MGYRGGASLRGFPLGFLAMNYITRTGYPLSVSQVVNLIIYFSIGKKIAGWSLHESCRGMVLLLLYGFCVLVILCWECKFYSFIEGLPV